MGHRHGHLEISHFWVVSDQRARDENRNSLGKADKGKILRFVG